MAKLIGITEELKRTVKPREAVNYYPTYPGFQALFRIPISDIGDRMKIALLMATARALSLGCCAGLDTPIEVLALSARNTFELWLRLTHILESDGNRQVWRNEAFTDQIQVYDAILTLQGPENVKDVIRGEIERVKQQAVVRGLAPGAKILRMSDLAKEAKCEEEYKAFYKLYSKLVHPSAWSVNMPIAVASEMYRVILIVNAQVYGWNILKTVDRFGISSDQCRQAAMARFREPNSAVVH
jgi:hypothetical protein